jgi:hypothetical protein
VTYVRTSNLIFKSLAKLDKFLPKYLRVVSHLFTGSLAGIGILPVSDLFGRRYFRSVLLIWRELLFSAKGGAGCIKKGADAPFFLKKGAIASFLREIGFPAKKIIPKYTDRDFLRYRYGKYREIPTDTDRKIPTRYTTLQISVPSGKHETCYPSS